VVVGILVVFPAAVCSGRFGGGSAAVQGDLRDGSAVAQLWVIVAWVEEFVWGRGYGGFSLYAFSARKHWKLSVL